MLRQNSENMGPPASLELYSTREAVQGHFAQTKKVNKLSQYYMDLYLKQRANDTKN